MGSKREEGVENDCFRFLIWFFGRRFFRMIRNVEYIVIF